MISCILTAYKEPRTIGAAIKALVEQSWPDKYEVLVVCPDEPTATVVRSFMQDYPQVRHLQDQGEGKPVALNLALSRARGEICVFTDGDVEVLPNAIPALLAPLSDPKCGAATGRPITTSPRTTMLGYWSHLLTEAGAHQLRTRRAEAQRYIDCSGYLYAARNKLLAMLPEETLADDTYLSQLIWQQGYEIAYVPEAQVAVRYPTTYRDWLLQKVRSSAGAAATPIALRKEDPRYKRAPQKMRSFGREAVAGFIPMLTYPGSLRERWWTLCLLAARVHLWFCVWTETRLKHRALKELWQPVESTK